MTTTDADTQQLRNGSPVSRFPGDQPPDKNSPGRGAPVGNKNAIRHGLTCGQLPKGCSHIVKQASAFRSHVEALTLEHRGHIGPYEACLVQTACEWLTHGLKARHWLKVSAADMTHDQKLSFSREVARAFGERDRVLRMLGLDRDPTAKPWNILDEPVESPQRAHHGDATESGDSEPADQQNAKSGLSGALDAGGSQVGDSTS